MRILLFTILLARAAFAGIVFSQPPTTNPVHIWQITSAHTDMADLLADATGYFAAGAGGLSFYTVTPCRALDTRTETGKLGFAGWRDICLPSGACSLPAASAYSVNVTALPRPKLDFLTLWAAGGEQPGVSTLNSFDGSVTSNAAIVPATNGCIRAYHTHNADLLLDVNGYFAP